MYGFIAMHNVKKILTHGHPCKKNLPSPLLKELTCTVWPEKPTYEFEKIYMVQA
jgi:hypothetical protein